MDMGSMHRYGMHATKSHVYWVHAASMHTAPCILISNNNLPLYTKVHAGWYNLHMPYALYALYMPLGALMGTVIDMGILTILPDMIRHRTCN